VGGVLDFRFVVQTATDLVPGALISSVGSASSPTPDLHSENDRAMVVTRVAVGNQAGLRIASIDTPDPAIVGSEVAYTLTVNNDGPATATNVTVTDTLPAGFTLVSSTPSQGSCTGATCAIGTVAPLATATVTIRAIPAATGLFTNVATVAGTEVDPVLATNTVSETTTVAGPDQADLVIQKFGPTLMPPGESSFYSIEVLNRGPAPALSVEIADPLPAGFRFVANTGDCVTAFPCEFETLEPGASRTIITTFTIDPALATPAVAVNTATIASNGVDDPNLTNNTSSLATTVYPAGTADLFVTNLESPDPVYTGTQLSYFLSIGNRGPSAAPDVTLTDVLPLGVTVISAVSTLGTCTGARVLTCQLGDMPPGSLVRVGILATAPAAVPVPNPMPSVASVTSGAPDPDPGNNQTTQRTTVVPPIPPIAADVSVAIVGPASVRVGQDVTYTLTVTNAGPSPASTVYLDDRALGLTFVSVTGDCVSSFPCALGTLAPGQSRVAVATFAVAANYSGANPIVNTAGVSTTTFDPALANNAATVRTLVGIDVRNEGCGVSSVRSAQTPGRAAPVVSGAPVRLTDFLAYDPPFSGGAFVTCGDVNGDGVPELITGPGPGAAPLVRVLDLRGGSVTELAQFFAYDPAFLGGVLVAAGDVTGDGVAEIVTGAGQGGGPHVRIWSLSGSVVTEIAGFFAYDVALAGGVSVALGDLTGDGVAEIVTGAGPGGGPHVRVWKVTGRTVSEIAGFFAYETAFAGGVWVAVGDVTGDGVAELVTGAGPGGGPHVRVWSLSSGVTEVAGFLAYDPAFPGGARVAVGDLTGDGVAELVTSAGPGGAAHVRVWTVSDGRIAELAGFIAYDPDFAGGATVAVGDVSGDGIAELITGSGSGSTAQVRIWTFDGVRVKETAGFFPYDPAFNGGVSVAVGDVTGDGVADVITGAGPGGGPHVSTWRMNGGPETRSAEFLAYATAFGGGVSVAAGDLTGDGVAEVVTGAGPGGGPHVRVWGLKGSDPPTEVASFFAYDPAFPGGVSVAVGDVTGDGVAELVTGAGPGGGPHVRVWSVIGGRVTEVGGFFSYDPAFRGGVSVAVGDLTGDGIAELVTGAGAGGGPHLRVWSLSGGRITEIAGFFAYDPAFRGGLSVAVGDLDGDGVSELVTGAGPGGSPDVRVWSLDGGGVSELAHFAAYDPLFTGGVFVAVGDIDGNGAGEIITGAGQGGGPHVRVWSINGGGFTAK
jgi:uncharacterized repeat protein (TIGR01451 family)